LRNDLVRAYVDARRTVYMWLAAALKAAYDLRWCDGRMPTRGGWSLETAIDERPGMRSAATVSSIGTNINKVGQ